MLVVVLAFLVYWCVVFPQHLVLCLTLIADILFSLFRLWRFLPWEWMHVRNVAARVAELRVGGARNFAELDKFARAGVPLEV